MITEHRLLPHKMALYSNPPPTSPTIGPLYSVHSNQDTYQESSASLQQERTEIPSKFPQFHDGDVLILDGLGHSWKLHSQRLTQASPILAKLLKDTAPIHLTKNLREQGKTILWRLKMGEFAEDPSNLSLRTFRAMVSRSFLFLYVAMRLFLYFETVTRVCKFTISISAEVSTQIIYPVST